MKPACQRIGFEKTNLKSRPHILRAVLHHKSRKSQNRTIRIGNIIYLIVCTGDFLRPPHGTNNADVAFNRVNNNTYYIYIKKLFCADVQTDKSY
jgi:hypothetical protein